MAAMFTRNKYIGWYAALELAGEWMYADGIKRTSVIFALQAWLSESIDARKAASQPAIFSVGMACKFEPCHINKWLLTEGSHGSCCCKYNTLTVIYLLQELIF